MPVATSRGLQPLASFSLAAFSGGGEVETIDTTRWVVRARLPRGDRLPEVPISFITELATKQTACEGVREGDSVAMQLFDPIGVSGWRSPPRRVRYEDVLSGKEELLARMKGKVAVVGVTTAGGDVVPVSGTVHFAWGVELIAEQVDAMTRGTAPRPIGPPGQFTIAVGAGFLGAVAAIRSRRRSVGVRVAVGKSFLVAYLVAAALLYRYQNLLIIAPFGVLAFAFAWVVGTWVESRYESTGIGAFGERP